MSIDKELVKEILSARTPRHFAFCTAGSLGALKVAKSKVSTEAQKELKTEVGGGAKVYLGRMILEKTDDGEKLVFLMATPDKSLEPKLKRTIKEKAGLTRVVEVRKLGDEPLPEGDDDDGEEVGDTVTDEQTAFQQLEVSLQEDIAALNQLDPPTAEQLLIQLNDVKKKLQQKGKYREACKSLRKLLETSNKALTQGTPEQQKVADKARFKSLRNRLGPHLESLKILNPNTATTVAKLLAKVDQLVGEGVPEDQKDYTKALSILLQLRDLVEKKSAKSSTQPQDRQQEATNARVTANEYRPLYEATKAMVQQYAAVHPVRATEFEQRLNQVASRGNAFQYAEAFEILRPLHQDVEAAVHEHQKLVKRKGDLEALVAHAQGLADPPVPAPSLQYYRKLLEGAGQREQEKDFSKALQWLTTVEERIRTDLSQRATFAEAARENTDLRGEALGKLSSEMLFDLDVAFRNAQAQYNIGEVSRAYDAITRMTAQIRQALRQHGEPKGMGKEGFEQTREALSQQMREDQEKAPKLSYEKTIEALQKMMGQVSRHDQAKGTEILRRLQAVRKLKAEQKTTEAEQALAKLVADAKIILHNLLLHRETTIKAPPRPQSLQEWTDEIINNGVLNKVKVGKELAAGGYGKVCVLEPNEENKASRLPPLVVKLPLDNARGKDKEKALEELQKEGDFYKNLGEHPNLLKCLGMQEVNGQRGLVMEQVRGKTSDTFGKNLMNRFAEGKITMTEYISTVQYMMSKTLGALDFLHSKGVAHNDIKPQNVMIDEVSGDIKVIDVGAINTLGDVVKGVDNPIYQAPENVRKEGSSTQTDSFAAGIVGFTALTGEQTFHFGDREGMKNSFMSDVEETIKRFGERDGDQAISGPVRTAYIDFLNGILHPDPTKRLSPKQALEHPFLRDMILPEEQVRALIQGGGEPKTGAAEPQGQGVV